MARRHKERSAADIKLKRPDTAGPAEKTLLDLADQRGLFDKARRREQTLKGKSTKTMDELEPLPPVVERIFETLVWTINLSALHFTLDVLVQNQYAAEMSWSKIVVRTGQAFLVFGLLFYTLHAHKSNPTILPGLPARYQSALRQSVFLVTSVCAGCYLIHITNTYGYLAVMKQAPPVGVLWVWAVIELNLPLAVLSLVAATVFLWQGGYALK